MSVGSRAGLALAGAAVLAASLPAAAGPSATDRQDPDVDRILARAEAAYDSLRTLRARFRQSLEMRAFEPPRQKEGTGVWYQKKPGLFRMDFEDPEGDLIVADGQHLWLYYPSSHPGQVVRVRLEGGGRGAEMVDLQGHIFREVRERFASEYAGRQEVSGAATHRIVLTPKGASPYRRVTVWIDARTHLIRRLEFVDQSETVRTITLRDLRPGTALPDSLFRFRPPPDVEVFEG